METLITLLTVFAAPGFALGLMFAPFAFDNPKPSSIFFALGGICVSTIVSTIVIPLLLVYACIWILHTVLPSSFIRKIDNFVLPISIKYFNKLPHKVRNKIGDFVASIDTPTLLNMHDAGFKIIPEDLKWLLRLRKEKKL